MLFLLLSGCRYRCGVWYSFVVLSDLLLLLLVSVAVDLVYVLCPNVFSGTLSVPNVLCLYVQIGSGMGIQSVCDMSAWCVRFCGSGYTVVCVVCMTSLGCCMVCCSCHVCAMWGLFWSVCQTVP